MDNLHADEQRSVSALSVASSAVVYVYALNKLHTLHGQQTSAGACAKHLRERVEGRS
jgi:hypothetical protein